MNEPDVIYLYAELTANKRKNPLLLQQKCLQKCIKTYISNDLPASAF
jgi:hypothetical protein